MAAREAPRARRPAPIENVEGVLVTIGRRKLVSFGGCDYLGLAKHDEVVSAAHAATDFLGTSASASRTTIGTMDVHVALERTLADYFGTRAAVHFSAGWLAPQAAARALAPECDVVLLDEGAHPSVADAATLTGLPVRRYRHLDAAHARRLAGQDRVLVLTDGAVRPLRALGALARRNRGHLVVDDAHGVGVLGSRGRGSIEAAGAGGPRVHLAGSLSKAFGSQGGFVVGDEAFVESVHARAAVVAGATPLAPGAAAAAECAIRLAAEPMYRVLLFRNVARMRRRLREAGHPVTSSRLPWFHVGDGRSAGDLARAARGLAARGFLVPHYRYFGAPRGGCLRITVTSLHTAEQIDLLAAALGEVLAGRAAG